MKKIEDPKIATFGDITKNDYIYIIPEFQRNYSWDKDNWAKLFYQILEFSKNGYQNAVDEVIFLGSVIFLKKEGNLKIDIVDGQQRLTTLLLLLIALSNRYSHFISNDSTENKNKNEVTIETIWDYLYSGHFFDQKPSIKLQKNDNEIYKHYLNEMKNKKLPNYINEKRSKITKCLLYFDDAICKNIQSYDEYNEFLKTIISKTNLIQINIQNIDDVFDFFETINSTGVKLSAMDLVKNSILRKYSDFGVNTKDKFEEWEEKIVNVLKGDIDKFALHFLISSFGSAYQYNNKENIKVSSKNLYKILNIIIDGFSKAEELDKWLLELYRAAGEYAAILDPFSYTQKEVELNEVYRLLHFCNFTQVRPIILSLRNKSIQSKEKFGSDKDKEFLINLINYWFKLMTITDFSPSKVEKNMYDLVNNINKGEDYIKLLESQITQQPIDFDKVKDFMVNKKYTTANKKYLLYKYFMSIEQGIETIISGEIEFEHILPVSNGKWVEKSDEWKEIKKAGKIKDYVDMIGNNIFLERKINKTNSNKPWNEKKTEFWPSNGKICSFFNRDETTKGWIKKEEILPMDIKKRNDELTELILKNILDIK